MKIINLLIILLVSFSTITFSQNVSVSKIIERRSTSDSHFDNKCEIELKISGDEIRKYKFVKISEITKAIDDHDLDLLESDERNDFEYEKIDKIAILKFETKIPARKATVVNEIAGELCFFNPTESNGSIVKISNYPAKTNTNLLPNKSEVQVIYLTKESLEKYAKEQELKKEEELKKLPEATRKMAEGFMGLLDIFSNFGSNPNDITFYVEGDKSKLVDIYFEDSNGKKIERNGRYQNNNIFSYSFSEKPNPNWKLVINIETNKSIKKVPFKIEKIELP